MSSIVLAIIALGGIGAIGALVLFFISRKFEVYEDPRIGEVTEALPAANCGGCGYPGCSGFAAACVKAETLDGLYCPVGGSNTMQQVAQILELSVNMSEPQVAVVRCNGNCGNRLRTSVYDGAASCAIETSLYGGDTGCSFGCLGKGDCAVVCRFNALHINPSTLLPEIDEEKCTACGACIKACPKMLIELRKKGPKSRRIYVSCMNKDKGAVARKSCSVACIACSKCQQVCSFEAIRIEHNLAYIDDQKCRLCRKCVKECPTSAIVELNFPVFKNEVV